MTPTLQGTLGIDFGTSNSAVAWADDQGLARLIPLEGQALASVGRKTEALAVLERFSRHRVHPQPRGVR